MGSEYLRIGWILRPQGVKGELKVQPLTDDPGRFRRLEKVWVETDGQYQPHTPRGVSVRADGVYLTLEGIESRNAAEALRGRYLCVDRAHAVKLPKGRYFVCDLLGCAVEDSGGKVLGKLSDILQNGPVDVYVVRTPQGGQILFPALKRLLSSVDIESRRIVVDEKVLPEVALYED